MASGTPFTVNDGDILAVCGHLDVASGSPSVTLRAALNADNTNVVYPVSSLVTSSGTVFTPVSLLFNVILIFDDGTLGWLEPSQVQSSFDASTGAIGNTNIIGNILNFPFTVKIDMLGCLVNPTTNAANFDGRIL